MSIKPKTKKAVKEKAKPAPKAKPVSQGREETSNSYCNALLIAKEHDDNEIFAAVMKKYPKSGFKKEYVSSARWTLNQALSATGKLERLFKVDGKLVPKSKLPKKVGSARKKVDPANDILKKKANIAVRPKAARPKK